MEQFLFFNNIERPAAGYPNGPEVIITWFSFAAFLFTIFYEIPNSEKFITSSFPSFVSPPSIFSWNSLAAF